MLAAKFCSESPFLCPILCQAVAEGLLRLGKKNAMMELAGCEDLERGFGYEIKAVFDK